MTEPFRSGDTVRSLIIDGAETWPDRVVFDFTDGTSWTRSQLLDETCRVANDLARRGVRTGDTVALFIENGPALVRAWLGAAMGGFVVCPMNTGYRGRMLEDVCARLRPSLVVVDDQFRDRFGEPPLSAIACSNGDDLRGDDGSVPSVTVEPWDTHAVLLTSGTTGGSKGSLTTHAYMFHVAEYLVDPRTGLGESDCFQADLPFCHLSALSPSVQMLRAGGRIAVRDRPNIDDYWGEAQRSGATLSILAGTMAEYLYRLPPAAGDREHSLRVVLASPLPSSPAAFRERFGVGLMTAYGLTEGSIVCVKYPDEDVPPGSCGRGREDAELRIVDEHDNEVAPGTTGELLIRNRLPWVTTQGYVADAEATVKAWRNNWLHTGDLLHVDDEGFYYFHDRAKDSLRRRGENISSAEVERDVLAHPAVLEVACIPAPQELGADDEVKVFIVPRPGADIDFATMLEFLVERMPHYMVPRFFELIDQLPKTPTSRVQKFELRALGNGPATWDREAHGYRVTRSGLRRPDDSALADATS